jgi:hypothetical protein
LGRRFRSKTGSDRREVIGSQHWCLYRRVDDHEGKAPDSVSSGAAAANNRRRNVDPGESAYFRIGLRLKRARLSPHIGTIRCLCRVGSYSGAGRVARRRRWLNPVPLIVDPA